MTIKHPNNLESEVEYCSKLKLLVTYYVYLFISFHDLFYDASILYVNIICAMCCIYENGLKTSIWNGDDLF